jgi:hypothetical protein
MAKKGIDSYKRTGISRIGTMLLLDDRIYTQEEDIETHIDATKSPPCKTYRKTSTPSENL